MQCDLAYNNRTGLNVALLHFNYLEIWSVLSFDPNHPDPNLRPLSLRIFRARFLRELFRF
jgi:hypothetical protein